MSLPPNTLRAYRLSSIDMMRGLVLVIMVLDHVRDYFMAGGMQNPMTDPNVTPGVFATRWITHLCAPVFVLLAGTSAGLMLGRRRPDELGAFLLKRGLWLIAIEWFVISTGFSFAPLGLESMQGLIVVPLQVIWAIGASMVVLSATQFLGTRACLLIGLAIIAGHNALDAQWPVSHALEQNHPLWVALHAQMALQLGPWLLILAYPLLPWIGVMLLGFGLSDLFRMPPARRDAALRWGGLALLAAFVALRASGVYGDPHPWAASPRGALGSVMNFFNVEKYPPSLLYALATLGPMAILCSYADRLHGAAKDALVMFGRVPFAFYVLHLYLIHALAVLLGVAQGFDARLFFGFSGDFPRGYGLPLAGVYGVWVVVVAVLYPFCRWVAALKARRTDWWLSYL